MRRIWTAYIAIIAVALIVLSSLPLGMTADPDQVPTEPLDFVVQSGDGQVLLSWSAPLYSNATNVTGYWIYRGSAEDQLSLWTTLKAITYYLDTGLANGQEYYYAVRAVNSAGAGNLTEVLSVIPMTTPSEPILPNAVPGNMYLNLTWDAPNFDGGSDIIGYNVYYSQNMTLVGSTPDTYLIHANLVLGRTYSYVVVAFNEVGEGDVSISFSGAPDLVPGVPDDICVTSGVRNVTLSWSTPDDNGGSDLIGYKIYRGEAMDSMSLLITLEDVLCHTDYGLVENATYYYAVSAFNIVGEGQISSVLRADVLGMNTVEIVSVIAENGTVGLFWQVDEDNALPAVRYWVYRGYSPEDLTLLGASVTSNYIWDDDVVNGITYFYQIAVENPSGLGWSNIVNATPCTTPTGPLGLTGKGYVEHITLTWKAPSDDGGSDVLGYKIYLKDDGDLIYLGESNVTEYVAAGLTVGTYYTFQVSACNLAGEGDLSDPVTLICGLAPSTPSFTNVTSGQSFVQLNWSEPAVMGSGDLLGYIINRTSASGSEEFYSDFESYNDTNVVNGVTYTYTVRSFSEFGESDPSEAVSATPEWVGVVPEAPSDLNATAGADYVTITWNASDDGGQPIIGYRIYRSSMNSTQFYLATVTDTWYNDTGRPNNSTYYYRVEAYNIIGTGDSSEVINATTGFPVETVDEESSGGGWFDGIIGLLSGPLLLVLIIFIAAVAILLVFKKGLGSNLFKRGGKKKGKGKSSASMRYASPKQTNGTRPATPGAKKPGQVPPKRPPVK
ncbi:MAG: fibronectin type III domain-containing protein [Methanomassiliicoccales archaeon]|nr:fibronectin type III domain-containing protein [Methanomassiliicoccales archaeon]